MRPYFFFLLLGSITILVACGDDSTAKGADDAPMDGSTDAKQPDDTVTCSEDAECDNGIYCDGAETCEEGACGNGIAVACDDGIACTEDICSNTTRSCRSVPPDEDRDGHFDAR